MTSRRMLLAGVLLTLSAGLNAQSAAPDGYAEDRPQRGMTMQAVERAFGTPDSRRAAVGDPPISRWIYPGFTVYFEHDRVIHAVVTARG